jgi:hypothetical protein
MSAATSTLPAGWSSILDEMHLRLDHAIASTNERIDQLPHLDSSALAQEQSVEIAKWCERLQRLSTYLASAEQVVQAVDEVLEKEETRLRQDLAKSGTLRQKLAEVTGRAIG